MQVPLMLDMDDRVFNPEGYAVERVSFDSCRSLIRWGHYTGSLTKGRFCYGLMRHGVQVGAAVFGQPSGRGVAASLWDGGDESNTLELLRLWVADGTGRNAESWFLARSVRLLPRSIACLVAYSSPAAGHYGICYQASNWLYVGESKSGQNYYYIDAQGNYVNKRIPWQLGPRSGRDIPEAQAAEMLGLRRVQEGRKHVYLLPQHRFVLRRLKRQLLPYPKPKKWSA